MQYHHKSPTVLSICCLLAFGAYAQPANNEACSSIKIALETSTANQQPFIAGLVPPIAVAIAKLEPLLIESLKQQQARLDAQQKEIDALKNR